MERLTAWMLVPKPYKQAERPQTNADRIRSMTDDELAEKLAELEGK